MAIGSCKRFGATPEILLWSWHSCNAAACYNAFAFQGLGWSRSAPARVTLVRSCQTLSYVSEGAIFIYVGMDTLDPLKWKVRGTIFVL